MVESEDTALSELSQTQNNKSYTAQSHANWKLWLKKKHRIMLATGW